MEELPTQIFLKYSFLDNHSPSVIFFSTTFIAVKFGLLYISRRLCFIRDTIVVIFSPYYIILCILLYILYCSYVIFLYSVLNIH